jgi:hypothetical protein
MNLTFCFAAFPLLRSLKGEQNRRFCLAASGKSTESENTEETTKNTDNLIQNNSVPNRLAPRQLPGVYMVLCLKNNKRYYGESTNLSVRLSQHKSRLKRNLHENLELQGDFNLYGENNFEFSCIYISRTCSKAERLAFFLISFRN